MGLRGRTSSDGVPNATTEFLIFLFTKLLAPTTTLSPISMLCLITAPIPNADWKPIFTLPPVTTPGAIDVKSLMLQSWSIEELVLIMQNLPIF